MLKKRIIIGVEKTKPFKWLWVNVQLRLVCAAGIFNNNSSPITINGWFHNKDLYHSVNRYTKDGFLFFKWIGFGDW